MQETSEVYEKIKELFNSNNVEYELVEHEPVYTSEQAAAIRGFDMHGGAKAMIFSADGKAILIVVPGDMKIDTRGIKLEFNVRDLRLLTPEEVKNLTGLEVGCIPPFGNVLNLPLYVDRRVLENEQIAFNPGSHTKSIKMSPQDFVKLCNPTVGDYAVEK